MNIKNHGTWHRYQPGELPEGVPASAMFVRRDGDGADWYAYANGKNFNPGSVLLTVIDGVVGAATSDPTALFPADATVLEVTGVSSRDPQKEFGQKRYDADKQTFRDPPPQEPLPNIFDLMKRIEALEHKKGQD